MMLFDEDGKIRRYESPEEILTEFFALRLQYYERRRVALLTVRGAVLGDGAASGSEGCVAARRREGGRAQLPQCMLVVPLRLPLTLHPADAAPRVSETRGPPRQDAEWEMRRANNKIRFILAVIRGTLVISNRRAPRPACARARARAAARGLRAAERGLRPWRGAW
jgi:hypothetical protein